MSLVSTGGYHKRVAEILKISYIQGKIVEKIFIFASSGLHLASFYCQVKYLKVNVPVWFDVKSAKS